MIVRITLLSWFALACVCGAEMPSGNRTAHLTQQDLFVAGRGGYHTYRIPSLLVSSNGTLLAFCEGRRAGAGDSGNIDLLLKRSTDLGRTWTDQQVVWNDGPNTCGNPCAALDRQTGFIWLLMTHNLGTDGERQIVNGTSRGTRTVWVTHSEDDGLTWSKPTNITRSVKRTNWTWYATGPGIGIQLTQAPHRGRLVIPCDHTEAGTKKMGCHVIVSDDHGATWHLGGIVPQGRVNECQVAERSDGTLMLNMRNYNRRFHCRAISLSRDGGRTWSPLSYDQTLIEPICQASLIRYAGPTQTGDDSFLFSNPADIHHRIRMTVRLSRDGGRTWPVHRCLNPGPSAYSCLADLPDGSIACLYERGNHNPYEKITFARFSLRWLGAAVDRSNLK